MRFFIMPADFYFENWLQTLVHLEQCVSFDLQLQISKHNDKKRCAAAQTLVGVMGEYCNIYNQAIEFLRQNMQLQKTVYIVAIINAVVARIIEIKHQLQKLESTNYQYFGQGLIDHKITVFDVEIKEVPNNVERTEFVKTLLGQAYEGAQRRREEIERIAKEQEEEIEEEEAEEILQWWNENQEKPSYAEKKEKTDFTELYKVEAVISEETLKRRKVVVMIQAHERCRNVTQQNILNKIKRGIWVKQLAGTLKPEPRQEVKDRGAMLIQRFFRAYFELKRQKRMDCRKDALLGLRLCKKPSSEAQEKVEKLLAERVDLRKKLDVERLKFCEKFKRKYTEKSDEIAEDFRDQIRDWFKQWYNEIQFFYDIPPESKGGSELIVKDEVPIPSEWLEEYKEYLRMKTANKGKTAIELKFEKEGEKEQHSIDKLKELRRKKKEAELLKKMMKNPTLHPGFTYPKSKKTQHILTALQQYQKDRSVMDLTGDIEAKERNVNAFDIENVCMEVKMEVRKVVDKEMREELKLLKNALKKDYKTNGEKMPESIKVLKKRKKPKKKLEVGKSENLIKQMEDLVLKEVLKEYPRTKFEDFIGEYNFAGNEYRCLYIQGHSYGGETRNIWWEQARAAMHGSQRILLVGPKGSGKTVLVHALASANDAVLLELDLLKLSEEGVASESLAELLEAVVCCARAVQPCVVYIRHVHRLYQRKKDTKSEFTPDEALMRKYLVGKLCKRIAKDDKITIIATCINPWVTKSAQLIKKFPSVVLIPNTTYTTVFKILGDWVLSNRHIPSDLNVHALAHLLQGYSFEFLRSALDNFLTADRIVKIAAYGLRPQEVYDYIMEFREETPVDYDQYIRWYSENTEWGKKEMRSIQAQLEFQALKQKFEEKMEKKRQKEKARGKTLVETVSEVDTVSDGALTAAESDV